ncbi:DNA internalization-related competence protein ComEC/Rec2 [Aliiglaciecola litoralis]|uniref:DNA internalization-related competence protein ComEC/Rec2 n=2 Tax=Aliiglaciecola litoralis TaxID=582857 RepID=A0ABN1LCR4_9ALTE
MPKQGMSATFTVKLKPIHGLANQGGFRYQQWLISQRIVATGYVKSASLTTAHPVVSQRQIWLSHLYSLPLKHNAWIAALTFGDKSHFSTQQWNLIQTNGIAHLVAISGLHLGVVALLTLLIGRCLLWLVSRTMALSQAYNYRSLMLAMVVGVTWYYAYLAGFSLPTVRAWLMLLLLSVLILLQRVVNPAHFVLLSLGGFLLVQPMSVLSLSFWLSFGAITAIGFILWRWPSHNHNALSKQTQISAIVTPVLIAVKAMCILQLMLSLLMLPLVASQFAFISFHSPIVNLIAIPIVTFCLVPLCLLAALIMLIDRSAAGVVFEWIDWLLESCLNALPDSQNSALASVQLPGIPVIVWAWSLAAIVLWCMPISLRKKLCSSLLVLPLLSYALVSQNSKWQLHVLDVGQGSAYVLETQGKAIVYDVGNRFPSGFNMADAVLLPFLQHQGLEHIDWLIISHFDSDHAGSLANVLQGIKVIHFASNQDICRRGWQLNWQALHIEALWPPAESEGRGNDNSCVLRISDGQHAVLLTGDISGDVEKRLVKTDRKLLKADVLIAAHHGSNTSSSQDFIDAVKPQFAVFSQGFLNRWDFPRQPVVTRFVMSDVTLYSTASSGQISFVFDPERKQIETDRFRQNMLPTWYNRYLWH